MSLQRILLVLISALVSYLIAIPTLAQVDPLCGTTEPIACSVYAEFGGIRDPTRRFYSDKFHAACARHDYCYRYGHATYGRSKYDCDAQFLDHMREICQQIDWRTFVTPGYNNTECRAVADLFYGAVRNADAAAKSYKEGPLTCEYEGFCPPGKFETTGRLNNCKCPVGHKVYTGIAKETAYCSGYVKCPPGRFATTGQYRGCECPEGSEKDYLDPASAYAHCTGYRVDCPGGTFNTTGTLRDCSCPDGSHKAYLDIAKARATCTKPCPSGKFDTTGTFRDCSCPDDSHKAYLDIAKARATCTKLCPSGEFKTTGTYRDCDCPEGKKKDYLDIFKYKAKCK